MRGKFLLRFLEKIGESAVFTGDFFTAFLTAGYGASAGRLDHEFSKIQSARERERAGQEEENARRQRFYNFVQYLKRDGLIQEKVKNGKKFFIRTPQGYIRLEKLKERSRNQLPAPIYPQESGKVFVIVAFDIPEKFRRKRDWIRSALSNLGLKKIQRSLWLGKVIIPREFINDLGRLQLSDYVEIFEISKTGTLRHVL